MNFTCSKIKAIRGSLIDVVQVVDNIKDIESQTRFIDDGLLIIKDGKVVYSGDWKEGKSKITEDVRVCDYRGKLIAPGFIDTHVHFPQIEIIGSYGEQLLEWLNTYTFGYVAPKG